MTNLSTAVVGHVEWVEFLRVAALPQPGEIVHARDHWEEIAGGGPAAAAQLSKLAGNARIFTAFGDDDLGRVAAERLSAMGLAVHAMDRAGEETRRAVTFVDDAGERTITVIGDRLNPTRADPLPWQTLGETDACYFTAGDVEALGAAREARVLVATSRVSSVLAEASVFLDALVGSALDPSETYRHGDIEPVPGLVVLTEGERGGSFSEAGGGWIRYEAVPPPGPVVDRYGAGDSFAGGLAFALAAGLSPRDAIQLASRCGAAVVTGRGPYERQLGRAGVDDLLARSSGTADRP